MKHAFIIFMSFILLVGCTKEIDLDLDNQSGTLVIEGNITDSQGPHIVRITRSVAFTEPNRYPAVSNATVVISDNTGQVDTLTYLSDGQYQTRKLVANPGKTYFLKVQLNGQVYTASSSMPLPVKLDSLTQDSISFAGTLSYSALPLFTDPVSLGNRYLFIVTAGGKKDKIMEVFSDNINNGIVNQRSIMLRYNNSEDEIEKGDTIHVEMQGIDVPVYTFYNALLQLSGDGPGGAVSQANPPSNISNGALGYFSAHTTAHKTMVIK